MGFYTLTHGHTFARKHAYKNKCINGYLLLSKMYTLLSNIKQKLGKMKNKKLISSLVPVHF